MLNQKQHILEDQNSKYLIYDFKNHQSELVNQMPQHIEGKICRKILQSDQFKEEYPKGLFQDTKFKLNISELDDIFPLWKDKLMYRRLIHLYQRAHRPKLFPKPTSDSSQRKNYPNRPHFLSEMKLFPVQHYRSMFITQEITESCRYQVIVNYEGRFVTEVVDDFIPVEMETLMPIWGMDINQPWLLILTKVWAKRKGGYLNLKKNDNFEFIKCFSNSNWRYYNLGREPNFLQAFQPSSNAEIILKSKNNNNTLYSGLIPDATLYKVVKILPSQESKKEFIVIIKSAVNHQWTGSMSIADKQFTNLPDLRKHKLKISQHMVMNSKDFYNLFSAAYLTSNRGYSYCGYHHFVVEPETKNAFYIELEMLSNSFLDFSILQLEKNKRTPNLVSLVGHKQIQGSQIKEDQIERYQKVKYTLMTNRKKKKLSEDRQTKKFKVNRKKSIFSRISKETKSIAQDDENEEIRSDKQKINTARSKSKKKELSIQQNITQKSIEIQKNEKDPMKVLVQVLQKLGKNRRQQDSQVQTVRSIIFRNSFQNQNEKVFDFYRERRINFQANFFPLEYECVQIDYQQGYNSGQAKFLNLEKGHYILKIKPEKSSKQTHYIFNYRTVFPLQIREFFPDEFQRGKMQRQSLIDFSEYVRNVHLSNNQYENIALGNEFQSIGYGFIAVLLKRKAEYTILIEVNPDLLLQSGYLLKNQYKKVKKEFCVLVKPGETTALVFKKSKNCESYKWPPRGIKFFYKNLFQEEEEN